MNGLLSFESTIEQTTETMPPATKQNRMTNLRELLPYRNLQRITKKLIELPQMNEMFVIYKEKTTIREIARSQRPFHCLSIYYSQM